MNYVYHRVPQNLQGTVLYPLNILKEKYPDIYEQQAAKYVGRETVMEQEIPILHCLWNDVLHFSAVHPKEIQEALVKAASKIDYAASYYQIDPRLIDPKNAIVYLYSHTDSKEKMDSKNFVPYNPDDMARFSIMPQSTKDYYKESIDKGSRPLLHHRVPHILYRGSLDVEFMPIISV